ncbi:hypothetical protein KDW_42470 [Dictyobacter vulcani]|uniref:Uncharacterized protein n=1 Tax=Dictyobacter vulcani TaxID=2607529 RepID=A0A5J4KQE7_9CHLR|nr:hypothetical protein [Dictyobacter vulcani]GER90085.1 hypothetical protein KDW_42470 [Dictyobacter vulcani]
MKPKHYLYITMIVLSILLFGGSWLGWNIYQQHLQTQPIPLGSTLADFEQSIGLADFASNVHEQNYGVYVFNDTSHANSTIQYQIKIREQRIAAITILMTSSSTAERPDIQSICHKFFPQDAQGLGPYQRNSTGEEINPENVGGSVYQSDTLAKVFSHQAFSDDWQGASMGIQWGMFVVVSNTDPNPINPFCTLQLGYPHVPWPQPIQS